MVDAPSEFFLPVHGLRRSKSESSKTKRISVMERIERFEEHARRSFTANKSPGKRSIPTIMETNSTTPSPIKNGVSKSQEEVSSPVNADRWVSDGRLSLRNPTTSKSAKFLTTTKSNQKPTNPKPANAAPQDVTKSAAQVVSAAVIPSIRIQPGWSWTELGGTVNADLREALEHEFFCSALLTSGCLATFDGEILGIYRGCRVSKKEIQTIVSGMMKREYITSSNILLGGISYSCLSATGHVIRARAGKLGINVTTFKKTVLVCCYSHPVLPKPIGKLVQDIEKFLSNFGY